MFLFYKPCDEPKINMCNNRKFMPKFSKETVQGSYFLIATTNQRLWRQSSNPLYSCQMGKIYFYSSYVYLDHALNFLHFFCNFFPILIYKSKFLCSIYYTFTSSNYVIMSSYSVLLTLKHFSQKQSPKEFFFNLSNWILKNWWRTLVVLVLVLNKFQYGINAFY
jgi:hypothetical protein